jgi:hypothetical protein
MKEKLVYGALAWELQKVPFGAFWMICAHLVGSLWGWGLGIKPLGSFYQNRIKVNNLMIVWLPLKDFYVKNISFLNFLNTAVQGFCFVFIFLFDGTGIWTQGFSLAKQTLWLEAHFWSILLWLFWRWGLWGMGEACELFRQAPNLSLQSC